HLSNFPVEWEGYFFRDELVARFGQEVTISNDARAFSVAESVLGVAAGLKTVVCVVLGTGVGGGVVIGGRLWKGTGSAGELGHQTVELDGPLCGCGNHGCIESIAGATAIISAGGKPTVPEVFEAARSGDALARTAVNRAISALAAGLGNAYLVLAPDAIVVGGGIAGAGAQLFDPLTEQIRNRVRTVPGGSIRVLKAKLGLFAGAVGSALIAAERINS
ncbi:MAG: ROK family protein, partial [Actinobacteria bacterium]|nr:ROK family protein [Actinomycetota bacterium]